MLKNTQSSGNWYFVLDVIASHPKMLLLRVDQKRKKRTLIMIFPCQMVLHLVCRGKKRKRRRTTTSPCLMAPLRVPHHPSHCIHKSCHHRLLLVFPTRLSPLPLLGSPYRPRPLPLGSLYRPRPHQASLASRRPQADTLLHQRGSSTISSLHRQASSRGTGPYRSLKLWDPAPLFPAPPKHLYQQHPQEHRLQQYRPTRSCGISKRRAPHLCLLHSNVGVLLQAVPALGEAEAMSIRHLLLMARVMVKHEMLHLRDRTLWARSRGSSGAP